MPVLDFELEVLDLPIRMEIAALFYQTDYTPTLYNPTLGTSAFPIGAQPVRSTPLKSSRHSSLAIFYSCSNCR